MKNSINEFGSDSNENSFDLHVLRLKYLSSADHVGDVMQTCGWKRKYSENVIAAACDLASVKFDRPALLEQTQSFFRSNAVFIPEGLETIPTCWFSTITHILWITRKPHWTKLPYFMTHCTFTDGVLAMRFAQEEPGEKEKLGAWDRVRALLNISVKPNIWTPLPKEQEREIWIKRPDLRRDLLNIPNAD